MSRWAKSRSVSLQPSLFGISIQYGPNGIPPHSNETTSKEAAKSVKPIVGKVAADVLRYIRERNGATCDEVECALELRHQTASARVCELRKAGAIFDSGEQRVTQSGRKAVVWRAY